MIYVPQKRLHLIRKVVMTGLSPTGEVIWQDETGPNMLHDEGEAALLSAYFATAYSGYGAPPANLYFGLDKRCSAPPASTGLAEADTLSSLSGEPSTGGYARQACSTSGTGAGGQDFVVSQVTGDYRVTTKTITFTHNTSGASWTGITTMFLCTVASGTSGKLICSVPMTTTRNIANTGESVACTIYAGLSE